MILAHSERETAENPNFRFVISQSVYSFNSFLFLPIIIKLAEIFLLKINGLKINKNIEILNINRIPIPEVSMSKKTPREKDALKIKEINPTKKK